MSISKERNGTYTVQYTQIDVLTQNATRTKKRGFKTLKAAREYERSLNRETSSIDFKSLFDEFLKTKDVEQVTLDDNIQMYNKYFQDIGKMKYEELTKPYFLTFRNKIASLDISSARKNRILFLVKAVCRYASDIYNLPNNSKVMKSFKKVKTEMNVWTIDEFNQFIDAIKDRYPKYVPFFHTLFWTGIRKGEARALQVDDLDIENGSLTISKSMRRSISSLKAPKTDAGKRKVKLDNYTLELLKPLKSHEKWLFNDYKPMPLTTMNDCFKYGIEKAHLKKIRIHDLRHSHATYLICNGANIVAVSKRLGHTDISMTLQTYTHLLQNTENELIEMINKNVEKRK